VKFSLTFGAVGPGRDPKGLAELARMAEDSGWDGVFLEDYIVYQGDESIPAYDPWICLAAMACSTSSVRLGTTVTPVPRRRPWKLAAEAVALDHLSDGRLILGVGLGDPSDPCIGKVNEPTTPRLLAERLDEALAIIDALWTGDPVHHHGTHYQVDGVRLTARPVQSPRIPIWVGGDMLLPRVRRRIKRWDGSCAYKGPTNQPHQPITPADVKALLAEVERERGSGSTFDIKVKGRDLGPFAEAGATWWGRWVPPGEVALTREIVRAGPPSTHF
jgi:hypothetical protein